MVNICLIQPPLYKTIKEFSPPLGLAYIAAYLKKFGYDSIIIDANVLKKDSATLIKEISGKFDLIGITVVTISVPVVLDLVYHLKQNDTKVKIVVGGIHPTVAYQSLLKMSAYIDITVVGEGEITFLEIIKLYEKDNDVFKNKDKMRSIDGIAFREDNSGNIICTKPRGLIDHLDTIPFPAFDKLPMEKYIPPATRNIGIAKGKAGFMVTARGCLWKCTFCASPTLWHKFRFRSAENIIEEIKLLVERYGIRQIDFQDDTLTALPERIEKICDFLINNSVKIKWNGFARVNDIRDENLLEKMYRAGCYELQFGIESANQAILDRCNKRIRVEETEKAVSACRKAGIKTLGYFIIGLPGETRDSVQETIEFAKELDLDFAAFYILLPYPGTVIFNELVRNGKINDGFIEEFAKDYSVFKNPVISACALSIEELSILRYEAIKEFYLSRRFIIRMFKGLLKCPRDVFPFIQILKEFFYMVPKIISRHKT